MKQTLYIKKSSSVLLFFLFILSAYGQNTSLPVGSIPGSIDVSSTGAATYTIPIEVAPGTQGIQPQLIISYNSQTGEGLLGKGWNLGGLSAICREGQKLYADPEVTPVSLNGQDRFSLDGNRLIVTNGGNYGTAGTTYGTEIETFVTVTSYGSISSNNCPEYFLVKTNEGTTLEYGRTADSRYEPYRSSGNTTPLYWQLNKVTDCNGNYMNYVYEKTTGESLIRYIRYTGNMSTGLATYNEIEFVYTDRNKNTVMVAGCEVRQTQKLSSIMVRCEGNLVRKYEFIYNEQGAVLQLKEVKLYGSDGVTTLNSTKIDWGGRGNLVQQTYLGANKYSFDYNICSGDINGDGKTDIILYPKQLTTQSKWHVNLANGSGDFTKISERNLYNASYPFYNIHMTDIDGDGKSEVLYYRFNNQVIYQETWKYDSVMGLFLGNTISFPGKAPGVVSGDFDGDGIQELLVFEGNDNYLIHYQGFENGLNTGSFGLKAKKILVLDFDGDGKAELMLLNESGYVIYRYSNTTGVFSLIYQASDLSSSSNIQTGDFNADGKTDLMVTDRTSGVKYKLYYNKGDNTGFCSPVVLSLAGSSVTAFSADLNRDGKDDILIIDATDPYEYIYRAYYTKGTAVAPSPVYEYEQAYEYTSFTNANGSLGGISESYYPVFGDFHGDGRVEFLYRYGAYTTHAYTVRLNDDMRTFVVGITDGMGKEVKMEYSHLSDPEVYTGTSQTYHCKLPSIRKMPLYVVKKLKTSNGLGGFNTLSYNYENLSVNLRGKGILGFESVSVTDALRQKISIDKYTMSYNYDPSGSVIIYHQMPVLKESIQKSTVGNTILSRTENTSVGISLLNYGRCIPLVSESISYDYLNNTKIVQNTTFDNLKYPEIIITKIYQGITSSVLKKTETTTYTYTTTVNSCRKISQQQTKSRQGTIDTTYVNDYTYDNKGNVLTEMSSKQNVFLGKTTYTCNTYGAITNKKIEVTGVPTRTESYGYDTKYRFNTSYTNPIGQISHTQYDSKTGNILTFTDINGLVTTYNYDILGRMNKKTFPDSTEEAVSMGWCTSSEAPNARYYVKVLSSVSNDSYCYYDLLGREVKRLSQDAYSDTRYNVFGQVEKTSLPYQSKTQPDENKIWGIYTYDDYGRLSSETGPYLNKSYSYGALTSSVTDNLKGVTYTQKTDVFGNVIEATDPGGTITYKYNNENQPIEVTSNGSSIKMTYDLFGNRTKLNDPNAGIITSTYNNLGQLTSQTDARNNTSTYQYDLLGRVTQKVYTDDGTTKTLTYTYDVNTATNKGKGQLSSISINGDISESFEYDNLGRLKTESKVIDGTTYTHNYTYNSNGQLYTLTYPGGFSVKYGYDANGRISAIRKGDNNLKLYEVTGRNKFGQVSRCLFANGLGSAYVYNDYGRITQIRTGNKVSVKDLFNPLNEGDLNETDSLSIIATLDEFDILNIPASDPPWQEEVYSIDSTVQNLRYTYDSRGLMVSRRDGIYNQCETFYYDNLERLTSHRACGIIRPQYYQYGNSGNITYSPYVGNYLYENPDEKPHAVSSIEVNSSNIMPSECCVTYNAFNRPSVITEDTKKLKLYYDVNQNRNKTIFTPAGENRGAPTRTKYFVSKLFEKEKSTGSLSDERELNYIYAGNRLIAIFAKDNANPNGKVYYIHQDHLGSYDVISSDSKTVVERLHFDPWGNRKNPANWNIPDTRTSFLFDRGFTGHEHLDAFAIINMNARLYDPVIGRFFSPDPYVQAPGSTQGFNRYTYCLNNPLSYVDPSGEIAWFVPVIIGAVIGTYSGGVIANEGQYNPVKWDYQSGKTWSYMLGGAVVGGVSGYAGWAIAGSGIPMANTVAIAGSSLINSVGTWTYTGGQTPISISFGVASYDFTNNSFGYLGKKGNKWYENLGYGMGALANLSDAVSLFRGGGQNVKVNSAKTTKDDWWGHSSITDESGNTLVSVGPDSPVQKAASISETWRNSIKGADVGWETYLGKQGTWTTELNNISTTAISKYASGITRWDLFLNSCIGHTSRALWSAGVPNIYLFHPHVLNAQLLIRQLGIYASPYLYQIP